MFKRLFIFTVISIIFSLSAYCFSEDNISALEFAKYGVSYPNESLGERLNRLETDYFGMAQTGDIDSRLYNLSKINSNARNGINIPSKNSYYNQKPKGVFKSFWDDLTSNFTDNGSITGYTPSIYNTGTYSGLYNNGINSPFNYNNNHSLYPYNNGFNHNYFHSNSPLNNTSFNGVNRFKPYSTWNNSHHHQYHKHNPNMRNYPYNNTMPYTNRTIYYTPPQIETKSSIHILRD